MKTSATQLATPLRAEPYNDELDYYTGPNSPGWKIKDANGKTIAADLTKETAALIVGMSAIQNRYEGTKDIPFVCHFSDGTTRQISVRAYDSEGCEILTPLALATITETKHRYELGLCKARLALTGNPSTGGGLGKTLINECEQPTAEDAI